MKLKFLMFAVATISFSGLAVSGGKDTTQKAEVVRPSSLNAWVPEQSNYYNFRVLDGETPQTIRIMIEGSIVNESILSVINLKGQERYRKVIQPVNKQLMVEVSYEALRKGVYFLKIDSGDEIRMKKLIINRSGGPLLVTTSTEG